MSRLKTALLISAAASVVALSPALAQERPMVGVSIHFMADDYARSFAETIVSSGEGLGLDVQVFSADGDPQKQLSDIQAFVTQGVDALVVIPIDEVAVVAGLQGANAAGIPIIAASEVPGAADFLSAVVGPSDFENGRATCLEMVADMADRDQGMDVGISTASVTLHRIDERVRGCMAALDEAGATVIETVRGLSPEEALANAQNLISANPEVDGIFGSFSNLVIGAANATRQAGRDDISVSGIDADRAIIQLIQAGYITSVAAQFPAQQADLIATAAAQVIAGETIDMNQTDLLPSRTVNAENAAERSVEIWGE